MKGKEQLSFEIEEEKSKSDNKEEKYWKLEFYEEKNFKDTEIGPIPEHWEVVRLGEVVKVIKGNKPKYMSEIYSENYVPYLTAEYLRTGIPNYFVKKDDGIFVEENDIVLIWDGSKAGDVFKGRNGILSSTMVKIQVLRNNMYNDYLFYFLTTKFDIFNSNTVGSTIPHVNKNIFQNLPIPLPSLTEQKAIAEVLSTIQSAREKTEEVIKATKELKKSIMKHLFTYGPVPIDQIDKIKLKETEIGPIPEHWEVVRLGEVAEILMGQSPPGESYNNKGDGIPFLQGKAEFGDIFPSYIKYTSAPIKIAKEGSVLISVRAPVGDVNISNKNYCIGRGLAALNMKKLGSNLFLFYYLIFSKKRIEELGTGTTFKSVSKSQLETLPIPLPPLAEQQKISEILQSIDEKIQKEEEKKKALDNLFKSMLGNLMSGKIRIKILEGY